MSDNKEPCPERDTANHTQRPTDAIDLSPFYEMFLNIEQRLPNFEYMMMAMNNYMFLRFSSLRKSNDFDEFLAMLRKGIFNWYTTAINSKTNKIPKLMDLRNQAFDESMMMKVDKEQVTNTGINKSTNTSASIDANKNTCEITNKSANADTCKSTSTNTCSHKSDSTRADTCPSIRDSTCNHKRTRKCLGCHSMMVPDMKQFLRYAKNNRFLEALPQSTNTNVDTDHNSQIIMPDITEANALARKRLPIKYDMQLGIDHERHWWRQTYDKIYLNVDISDLVDCIPNIKVVVTIIDFKIKMKRLDKWIVIVSNKFVKAIGKCKWVVDKYKHVKLTINKRENEYWNKCLITETRELNLSNFKNKSGSSEFERRQKLEVSPARKECLQKLSTFLQRKCGIEGLNGYEDKSTVTNYSEIEEQLQDSAINVKLFVEPNIFDSLNFNFEDPSNEEQPSMVAGDPSNEELHSMVAEDMSNEKLPSMVAEDLSNEELPSMVAEDLSNEELPSMVAEDSPELAGSSNPDTQKEPSKNI